MGGWVVHVAQEVEGVAEGLPLRQRLSYKFAISALENDPMPSNGRTGRVSFNDDPWVYTIAWQDVVLTYGVDEAANEVHIYGIRVRPTLHDPMVWM